MSLKIIFLWNGKHCLRRKMLFIAIKDNQFWPGLVDIIICVSYFCMSSKLFWGPFGDDQYWLKMKYLFIWKFYQCLISLLFTCKFMHRYKEIFLMLFWVTVSRYPQVVLWKTSCLLRFLPHFCWSKLLPPPSYGNTNITKLCRKMQNISGRKIKENPQNKW